MTQPRGKFNRKSRVAGRFVALPWTMLDCPAYVALSVHAKALLIEIARQLNGSNNGMLLCSRAKLVPRGWTSNDMLTKSRRELIDAGFLHQTVMGQRPNRASWFAVTWCDLDRIDGFDPGAAATFRRGAYEARNLAVKPDREELFRRWEAAGKTRVLDRGTVQNAQA